MRVNVYGVIIPNGYKWYFDYWDEDSTCPKDITKALSESDGEEIEVYINSPGGIIEAGSEIYTALREYKGDIKIKIVVGKLAVPHLLYNGRTLKCHRLH